MELKQAARERRLPGAMTVMEPMLGLESKTIMVHLPGSYIYHKVRPSMRVQGHQGAMVNNNLRHHGAKPQLPQPRPQQRV